MFVDLWCADLMAPPRIRQDTNDVVTIPSNFRSVYEKYLHKKHKGTRYYAQTDMEALGLHNELSRMMDVMGLTSLLLNPYDSYPELTAEFLSTFEYDDGDRGMTMKFHLGNAWRRMTLAQFNNVFGFPNDLKRNDKFLHDLQLFWYKITGIQASIVRDLRASDVIHPCFRVVHRLLGYSLYGRTECTKLRQGELACLWAIVSKDPFDLGFEFVGKLIEFSPESKGEIWIGGLITRLACHFGVDLRPYTKVKFSLIDQRHLLNAEILKMKNDRIGVFIKKLGDVRGLSSRRIRTTTIDSWYTDWVGERLPTHQYEIVHGFPFVEEEIEDSEDGNEDEEEEEDEDEDDETGDTPMTDAPALPSHFERGGPSGGHDSYEEQFQSINERLGQLQTSFDGFRGTMESRMDTMYDMQARMYYHTMGSYYDPSAPFPPPPPPPQ